MAHKEILQIQNDDLTISGFTLEAHKFNPYSHHSFISFNYVYPDPRLPLPYPKGDWYLGQTVVVSAALNGEETPICCRLIPGVSDYYRNIGLLSQKTELIEVDPIFDRNKPYGYPNTSPLAILAMNGHDISSFITPRKKPILVSTFMSSEVAEQAEKIGLNTLPAPDSVKPNSKAQLRSNSEKYNIPMLPGIIINGQTNLKQVVSQFKGKKVWIKFPTGSGGDLVLPILLESATNIIDAVHIIRNSIEKAINQGNFNTLVDDFWPSGKLSPDELPLVLELDANYMGEVILNGSTQYVTRKSAETKVIGHFRQITTPDGEYLGNTSLPIDSNLNGNIRFTSQIRTLIENNIAKIALYNIQENGYYGIQGADWFLVLTNNDKLKIFIDEVNARPTANTPPVIIVDKLKKIGRFSNPVWVNTNCYQDKPIKKIDDYIKLVGKELAFGTNDSFVLPQSFRTLITGDNIIPSADFKALVIAENQQTCEQTLSKLQDNGIRFKPSL